MVSILNLLMSFLETNSYTVYNLQEPTLYRSDGYIRFRVGALYRDVDLRYINTIRLVEQYRQIPESWNIKQSVWMCKI